MKFPLGQMVMTPGVQELVLGGVCNPAALLARHAAGDWGDLDEEDKAQNEAALRNRERLFSMYRLSPAQKVYVITERDRSVTTLLLPEEY